jgi:eukaryotic-like serine/threonine-protein kinase
MPDLRSQLESNLGASYTIERELGGGGMARVYVASERALGRRVVIKVLKPELAAEVSNKRFQREILLAAGLQHANIVPVLAAGETDGIPHYVMPYVEGQSLRARLEDAVAIPRTEAVGILRDIARALTYAHERGIVHRDIKPENILLSGDAAVVTDFGIAKAISNARTGESRIPMAENTITQLGTVVGTPAYMAPEQISMDPTIDHRADLYAFGCVAYELLGGTPPFASTTVQSLFAAHLSEAPRPIDAIAPELPPELASLVMRCLEKDPAKRPQSAREVLRVLEGPTTPTSTFARIVRTLSRRQRAALIALGIAVLVAVGAGVWRVANDARGRAATPAVVVIPFLNTTGDSTAEYLADGVADGLATALGKVSGITVASRSLGYQYKGQRSLDIAGIGARHGVSHVLHGSLRRSGDRLRVSAQLTSVRDNRETWSEDYDRVMADAFAVQDEITRVVATELRRHLGDEAGALPASARSGTTSPQAYDLYLRGRYLLQRRGAGVRQGAALLQEAIAQDTNFGRAHAAYALAIELLPYFERINTDSIGRLATRSAQRALRIDSTIAEAHTAMGLAHQHQWQWRLAEDSYRRAIAAQPPDADAYIQYARFLFYTRTVREALPLFERARDLDPQSAVARGWVGHLLELSGRYDEAMAELRRALEIDSTVPPTLVMMAQAHLQMGRRDSARFYAERLWRVWPNWRGSAGAILAHLGERERSLAALREIERDPTGGGGIYLALRDSTRWFESHERATAARTIWPTYSSLNERHIDFMRGSARFARIVRSVGLDERIFTAPEGGRR